MRSEQLEQRSVAGADQGEKVASELLGERLLSALGPDWIVARVGAASESGQSRVHSGKQA